MDGSKSTHLSPSVSRLEPSKIGVAYLLAKSLMEDGHDVINLAVGEPDCPTPDPIAEAGIEAIHSGFTKYTEIAGIPELRAGIRQKLQRNVDQGWCCENCGSGENGLEYSEEEIVVSNGAHQAAFQAIMATCGPGDEVHDPSKRT